MPLTRKEIVDGEWQRPPGFKKLYLIPGEILGTRRPQTLVALDEQELEEYKRVYTMIVEIGDAHPDLDPSIEWEVYGVRRKDITELPGHPLRKKGDREVDEGIQQG